MCDTGQGYMWDNVNAFSIYQQLWDMGKNYKNGLILLSSCADTACNYALYTCNEEIKMNNCKKIKAT